MRRNRNRAFTLIEIIVTLAIVAALLSVLAVSFIKSVDRVESEKESAAVNMIGAAFKEYVKRTRYVPDQTDWASSVATQLGWQVSDVTSNNRNFGRVFLIDPDMQIGVNSVGGPILPYSQPINGSVVTNVSGAVVRPFSPRFMVISSLGTPLPGGLVSGLGASSGPNAFGSIWATPEGSVPPGWSWSNARDLKIARIDLTDLFVAIGLANGDPSRVPTYGVDGFTPVNIAYTAAAPPPKYFIRGSELKLYNASGALEYSEILYIAHDFTFELGTWTGKPYLGRSTGTPSGKDLQRAMDLFMRAPHNAAAKSGATRQKVHDAMISYMTNFIAWRNAGYPGEGCPGPVGNNAYSTAVGSARSTLSTESVNLISP